MHSWDCLNSDGMLLKKIFTGSMDRQIASRKVKARFGDNACFVELKYAGLVPMKLETIAKEVSK